MLQLAGKGGLWRPGPRRTVTQEQVLCAAELLEQGASLADAGRGAGISLEYLRRLARREPRLAAALPPRRPYTRRGKEVARRLLPGLWADASLSTAEVCRRLGVCPPTARTWAREAGLPRSRRVIVEGAGQPAGSMRTSETPGWARL
ncbi:hypothetical protein ACVW0K_007290 [Streptomyces filamentosus]